MDIKDIQNLIRFIAKSGASEVKLEIKDVKITVKTGHGGTYSESISSYSSSSPLQIASTHHNPSHSLNQENEPTVIKKEDRYVVIKSPMIGTFYRRPAPDKAAFVEAGKSIKKGDVICVIEAMKLFNEIESDISGTIIDILVDDMSPVEFDQPLFLVDPS